MLRSIDRPSLRKELRKEVKENGKEAGRFSKRKNAPLNTPPPPEGGAGDETAPLALHFQHQKFGILDCNS